MKQVQSYRKPAVKIFGTSAVSAAIHVFGSLTCATCWAIFGPALALLFGSSGTAALALFRPYAPLSVAISALGLTYSIWQLYKNRGGSTKTPYRMAAAFTALSIAGWAGSAAYTVVTFMKG